MYHPRPTSLALCALRALRAAPAQAALKKRHELMNAPEVVALITSFWDVVDLRKNADGTIGAQEYMESASLPSLSSLPSLLRVRVTVRVRWWFSCPLLHSPAACPAARLPAASTVCPAVNRKLQRALVADYDADTAERAAAQDWEHDVQGRATMDFEAFLHSMFELADMWTLTAELQDYCREGLNHRFYNRFREISVTAIVDATAKDRRDRADRSKAYS